MGIRGLDQIHGKSTTSSSKQKAEKLPECVHCDDTQECPHCIGDMDGDPCPYCADTGVCQYCSDGDE